MGPGSVASQTNVCLFKGALVYTKGHTQPTVTHKVYTPIAVVCFVMLQLVRVTGTTPNQRGPTATLNQNVLLY